MSFAHPYWFAALAVFVALLLGLYVRGERRREATLRRFIAARLQGALAGGVSLVKRRFRFALLLAGLAGVFAALAQPRLGYEIQQRKTVGRDVIIAIDVSRSMLANDLAPSRLARAKLAAEDLIGRLHGDRMGLVAFAGSAFLQAPLTIDYSAVRESLHELDTNSIPLGGTDIAEAIRTAADAFGKGEGDQHALVLITDGEELDEDAVAAAKKAAESMRIFTVGVGSPEGTIIALPGANGQTEYVKSPDGQIVKSALDEARLRAIAEAANGFYVHLESGPAEMENIVRQGLDPMSMTEADTQVTRRPIERYRWPLAAGLLLLAASVLPGERRRPGPAVAALLLLLALPVQAKNPGVEAYEQKDFPGALKSFEEQAKDKPGAAWLQFDVGAAAFQSGDYERALDAFSKSLALADPTLRPKAEYNLGNTLFERGAQQTEKPSKLKDWKNSLQHFDQALKADAKDENARYNRDLVAKMIQDLEREQKKEEEQKSKDEPKDQQKQDQKDQQDKQQQQNKKDQQQKGGGKDRKDQKQPQAGDGQGEQGQSGQPKEGNDSKDAKDQQSGQQPKNDPSKGQDGKDQRQAQDGKGDRQDQLQPEPAPGQQDRKLSGQITDTPQHEKGDAAKQAEQAREEQAIEDAQAAAEGKMTPAQAAALLDSLKSADDRVRLLNPRAERRDERPVRDW